MSNSTLRKRDGLLQGHWRCVLGILEVIVEVANEVVSHKPVYVACICTHSLE